MMDFLADMYNLGRVVTFKGEDYFILKILGGDHALARKTKDVLPAPVYEIKIEVDEGKSEGKGTTK